MLQGQTERGAFAIRLRRFCRTLFCSAPKSTSGWRNAPRANWLLDDLYAHELVVSLRNFIRDALDLDPIPPDVEIPMQGPTPGHQVLVGAQGLSVEMRMSDKARVEKAVAAVVAVLLSALVSH